MSIEQLLYNISEEVSVKENRIKFLSERNAQLVKNIAMIRSLLEKSLKNPTLLNHSVYESIDLCRLSFNYLDYTSGKLKRDPPLTESEKTLV
jgi:hypothetical protein